MIDDFAAHWPSPMLPLMTPAELPAVDGYMAQTGTSGFALMERAGAAVARAAAILVPTAGRIVVVAGPANNGGDCMCAARVMRDSGRSVSLVLFGDLAALKGDPARAAAAWNSVIEAARPNSFAGADLIVDGLYGGGHRQEITGEAAAIVDAINAQSCPVLSVDFPTGISGASGGKLGSAVKADATITFFCLKPGHLLMPGRSHSGVVVVDDIGIPASVMDLVDPKTFRNSPALWRAALTRSVPAKAAVAGVRSEFSVMDDHTFGVRFPSSGEPKFDQARAAARASRTVTVVVGQDTVVAEPEGRVAITGGGPADTADVAETVRAAIDRMVTLGMPSFESAAAVAWALAEMAALGERPNAENLVDRVNCEIVG